jgi:DNA-binding response OmpR family regulator
MLLRRNLYSTLSLAVARSRRHSRAQALRALSHPQWRHVYRPKVLFIDDEPSICTAMQILLDRHGFDVRVAMSSEAGCAEVQACAFDAVVLDYWIENGAGYCRERGDEILPALATLDPALSTRTIFVTGDPSERTRLRLEQTGATYLLKPFEIGLLVNALQAMIQSEGVRLVSHADQSTRSA